jgi:hypothetical protein
MFKNKQQEVDSNRRSSQNGAWEGQTAEDADGQKLKRRRVGSTKKALCLTVVTD